MQRAAAHKKIHRLNCMAEALLCLADINEVWFNISSNHGAKVMRREALPSVFLRHLAPATTISDRITDWMEKPTRAPRIRDDFKSASLQGMSFEQGLCELLVTKYDLDCLYTRAYDLLNYLRYAN